MTDLKILLKLTGLVILAGLISCAGENTKEVDSDINNDTTSSVVSTKSVTKRDREKYRDGITALHNNELSKAQRIFAEFIRSQPKLAGAYTNLALVFFKKNDLEKSFKTVEKALQLNPKQPQALNLRAQLYINNGKIHKAKDDYLLAISIKPKYANAQYNLALLYDIYMQEIELAIKHYKLYMMLLKKPDEATLEWVNHLEGTLKDA